MSLREIGRENRPSPFTREIGLASLIDSVNSPSWRSLRAASTDVSAETIPVCIFPDASRARYSNCM